MTDASGRDLAGAVQALEEFKAEVRAYHDRLDRTVVELNPARFKRGQAMLKAGADVQIAVILASLAHSARQPDVGVGPMQVAELRARLLKRELPLTECDITALAGWLETQASRGRYPDMPTLAAIEHCANVSRLPEECARHLERVRQTLRVDQPFNTELRLPLVERIGKLLGEADQFHLEPGEAWSDAALADLEAMDAAPPGLVRAPRLLSEGRAGPLKAPWLEEVRPLVESIGQDEFARRILRWFPLVDDPPTKPKGRASPMDLHAADPVSPHHVKLLKGLARCAALGADRGLAHALAGLALSGYRMVPGKGPRLVSIGHAAVAALGMMPGMDAVGQLALLKGRVQYNPARKEIEKTLAAAAERENLPLRGARRADGAGLRHGGGRTPA